ncbi:LacI family DNA-binding transcriptional regulator [Bradyrhizobium sp. CCBAU 45389]|uniref:LacI family DNA-binding transcriptional regulator n=1 Tax=Bradyrhizobium sp. CCBAU 45389 TaxID=858429 RepID=UPI002305D753|nr:substrate-binding domain-containing protein [Bradyrhizobium sp. CCBAU 45389]MDA9398208.1 transcriptional regulator [Bradyrhizobium sp. CCBAU 45389]
MPSHAPRSQTVKVKDVAREAGVAVGTVSRVLNDHPAVTRELRERVEKAMAHLGYEVDVTAQSMRAGRSRLVACAIRDFDIPRFALFIKEAEAVLREAGYTLLLASTTNRSDVEIALLRAFRRRRVDGVMMTLSDEQHQEVREALLEAPMPVLLIDRDRIEALDRVTADHRAGARLATGHLLGLGHRKIAMLVGDLKAFPSRSRLEGFRAAYAAAGIAPDPRLVRDNVLSSEDAYRATASLMGLAEPPTALFVAAMDMLGGCLRALRTMGVAVGDGISVVAGSDSDLAELHTPPITAIAWDLAAMGRHAATMLLERMRGDEIERGRGLAVPTELIIRGSSRPFPG